MSLCGASPCQFCKMADHLFDKVIKNDLFWAIFVFCGLSMDCQLSTGMFSCEVILWNSKRETVTASLTSLRCLVDITMYHNQSWSIMKKSRSFTNVFMWYIITINPDGYWNMMWNHDRSWTVVSITIVVDHDLLWCILMWKIQMREVQN